MHINNDKNKVLNLYKHLLLKHYKATKSIDLTSNYLEKIKLTEKDYEELKKLFKKEKTYKLFTTETEQIIKTLKNKLIYPKIEYDKEDIDPTIYFHIEDNTTYLVNYDSIENKWYLSLLETSSYNLIKEIYSSHFDDFHKYIKNLNIKNKRP